MIRNKVWIWMIKRNDSIEIRLPLRREMACLLQSLISTQVKCRKQIAIRISEVIKQTRQTHTVAATADEYSLIALYAWLHDRVEWAGQPSSIPNGSRAA